MMTTLGLGCHDDKKEPDPERPTEWDGNYVPLEEKGDHIDTGPFASCSVVTVDDAGNPVPCGSLESFNLSSCDRSTLSRLSPDGVYSVLDRSSSSPFSGFSPGGFRVSTQGGPEAVNGLPLLQKHVDGQTFYVSSQLSFPDGTSQLFAFAGCQAENEQRFTGCSQTCINGGEERFAGTFQGVRTQRIGEPELSGIEFVSESRVDVGTPVDVYVTKNHAYVVALNYGRGFDEGGLAVFDVSDKAHPVLKKVVKLEGDAYWNSVWAKDDALYVGSGNHGVLVFDITDPANPQMVRGVPGDTFDIHTLFVDGNRLYAQSSSGGQALIFDVSNALSPVLLARYGVPADPNGRGYPHDSFAYQNRLYISQMGQGYYVLDVTDGSDPKPLGSYTYDASIYNPSHTSQVGTFAGRTIAFEGGENVNAHLRVLDVTDPAHVVKIGEYKMRPQSSIHNMVLRDKRLYVVWYAEGLRVLDVSNPTQPKEIAYANTFRDSDLFDGLFVGAIGIRVPGDGYVYVVDMTRGLLIYREP
ncbi:LVIVD repeat-containing protein [Hyalangium versicolor]|uniref:LVIVD repeat-containing protein n=1 Tax=Hyalangium versicolor TaxID=2861190 RepID=UPI001CCA0A6B|nr:hypothetical protein [Hyalangium versicolor]